MNIISKFQLPSSYCLGVRVLGVRVLGVGCKEKAELGVGCKEKAEFLNQWGGVCRTAPATSMILEED